MELFRQALIIMALGMGLTFVFLYFVIMSVRLTGWLVCRHETRREAESAGGAAAGQAVVAAVAAALHERAAETGAKE